MASMYIGRAKWWGLCVLLPLLALWFGIRPTWESWHFCREQRQRLHRLAESDVVAGPGIPDISGKQVLSNGQILEHLWETIQGCGVTVVQYTPHHIRREGPWEVYVGELTFSGRYAPLLKVVDVLEQEEGAGKIVSVAYRMFHDFAKKEEELRMSVFLQAIEKKE